MTREARHIIHQKVGTNTGGHPGQTSGVQTRKCLQQRAKRAARSLFNLEDTGSAGAEKIDGDIAQLGERLPCKQEVSGSNPLISTKKEEEDRD